MTTVKMLVRTHPVAAYVVLAFGISWGGFVLVVGPRGFPGNGSQFDTLLPLVVAAMLAGPSVAGILLTGLLDGRSGLRELLSRLLTWRVATGWYALALLPAPLLAAALLFPLSLTSPIFTANDKTAVLLSGIAAGLTTVLEEVGWTGFAVPRLRHRHGVLATGLIVGIMWGAWHLLQALWIGGTYAGDVPLGLYISLSFLFSVAQLTAYRVLMVWLYESTESLFVVTLMHASLTASLIFIFTPLAAGVPSLIYGGCLAAALWIVVAMMVVASRQFSRQPLRSGIARTRETMYEGADRLRESIRFDARHRDPDSGHHPHPSERGRRPPGGRNPGLRSLRCRGVRQRGLRRFVAGRRDSTPAPACSRTGAQAGMAVQRRIVRRSPSNRRPTGQEGAKGDQRGRRAASPA
jgi:membrane protease YdiL (CAAX protease family)